MEKSDGAEERNAFKEVGASDRALACCGLFLIVVSLVVSGVAGFYLWRTLENERSEAASSVARLNNLKLIGTAIQKYSETNGRTLPPAILFDAEDGRASRSWRVLILPYWGEEEKELYEQIRLDEPWDSEWNSQFHNQMPAVFACPAFDVARQTDAGTPPTLRETTYSVVVGEETAFPGAGKGRKWEEIADGTEHVGGRRTENAGLLDGADARVDARNARGESRKQTQERRGRGARTAKRKRRKKKRKPRRLPLFFFGTISD